MACLKVKVIYFFFLMLRAVHYQMLQIFCCNPRTEVLFLNIQDFLNLDLRIHTAPIYTQPPSFKKKKQKGVLLRPLVIILYVVSVVRWTFLVEYYAFSICCSKMLSLITVNMSLKKKEKHIIQLWHIVSHFLSILTIQRKRRHLVYLRV